jgi:hypothetical protein
MANGASALILRWKVQFACAVVWWVAAITTCFGTDAQSLIVFLVAIFLCQIVFGIYGVIAEAQERKRRGPIHAWFARAQSRGSRQAATGPAFVAQRRGKGWFTWLRAKAEATDGNLGAQLLKLEESGYVAVEKKFVLRKPQTLYRITETGRQALTEYVQALKKLLGPAINA